MSHNGRSRTAGAGPDGSVVSHLVPVLPYREDAPNLLDVPVVESWERHERADAARNRAKVLAAAERVFAERDPRLVTMTDIAKAARIGRATLYRRYPDPASVAVALLDEHERLLQEQLLFGRPPLGPGASPADRLGAFYQAMVDLLDRHLHLVLGAQTGHSRLVTGVYQFWRAHVRYLVSESGVGDPVSLGDILLAPLAPEVYRSQRFDVGLTKTQIVDALVLMAARLLRP